MSQPLIRSRMKIDAVGLADRDPNETFEKAVYRKLGGKVKDYQVLYDNVLVATYVAPSKTSGGIIKPNSSIDEDRWQGITGMVLKLGETAFKYDGAFEYKGQTPKVGDFVMYHTSDSREVGINGVSCRLIPSSLIRMIVPDPDVLY
jgi:co-chaperonin GroES (HSP10)